MGVRARVALEDELRAILTALDGGGWPVTVERLVELVIRSLTAEHEVADVHRGHSSYTDRVPRVVVDRDRARWRVLVMVEPWRRRHDLGSSRSSPGGPRTTAWCVLVVALTVAVDIIT